MQQFRKETLAVNQKFLKVRGEAKPKINTGWCTTSDLSQSQTPPPFLLEFLEDMATFVKLCPKPIAELKVTHIMGS